MKITKRQLRRIIKEELYRLNEGDPMSLAAMRRREEDEEARAAFSERPRSGYKAPETYIGGPAGNDPRWSHTGHSGGRFLTIDKIKELGSPGEVLRHLGDELDMPIDDLDDRSLEKVNDILG